MKKYLVCIAALAAGYFSSPTQAEAQSISIGPRFGLNISTVSYSDGDKNFINAMNEDKTSLTGIMVGLAANFKVNEMFSIQPEFLFNQKGYKLEDGADKLTESLNYLEMPVLAKLTFGDDDLKFFVNAGPYAAYLMSGEINANINGNEHTMDVDFDYPALYNNDYSNTNRVKPNRVDLGFAAGAGIALQAGIGTFNLEARYDFGLNNINEYEKERPNNVPKVTNRSLGFSVGYLVPLVK